MTDLPNEFDAEKLGQLILNSLDGSASDADVTQLNDILRSSTAACEFYLEFIETYTSISQISRKTEFGFDTGEFEAVTPVTVPRASEHSNVSLRGVDLEEIMADVDIDDADDGEMTVDLLEILELVRTSPAVEIEKTEPVKPKPELIQKVESNFKWFPGRPSRHMTRTLLAMAACFVGAVCYVHFFAPKQVDRPVVAYLDDSINAVWDDDLQMPDQDGEMVQSRYRLKEGFASILFDSGAKVTVEAPAELSLFSAGEMELFSGKIYAVVPKRAHGFSVMTAGNKIVDLGTEFGVELDDLGNTQLHVTKGETLLYSGPKGSAKTKRNVDVGQAKKIYNDGFVKDIPVVEEKFARKIDSKDNLVFLSDDAVFEAFVSFRSVGAGKWKRHHAMFLEEGPNSPKGVTLSVYAGKYNPDVDYDNLTPLVTTKYKYKDVVGDFRKLEAISSSDAVDPGSDLTFIARGYIEMRKSGKYIFKAGWNTKGSNSHLNKVEFNGRKISRKKKGGKRFNRIVEIKAGKRYPIKVTYYKDGGKWFWVRRMK